MRCYLEQAFTLPLPTSCSSVYESPFQPIADLDDQLPFWNRALDQLSDQKLDWERFQTLLAYPLGGGLVDHIAAQKGADRNGQTLLHIAVNQNLIEVVKILSTDRRLCQRRDRFGLTPLDLAQFLYRPIFIPLLGGSIPAPFCSQPNVIIEEKRESLERLSYLPYPVFSDISILHEVLDRSGKAKHEDTIPSEKIWMGIYFDKEIQRGIIPKVAIEWIDNELGFGVFAAQKIPSCSCIGEYTGIVHERSRAYIKGKTYCVRYTTWQMSRKQFTIDAEEGGNFTRFINHSDSPNIALHSVYWRGMPRMLLITLKQISIGQQLSIDYGKYFWKESNQIPKKLI